MPVLVFLPLAFRPSSAHMNLRCFSLVAGILRELAGGSDGVVPHVELNHPTVEVLGADGDDEVVVVG